MICLLLGMVFNSHYFKYIPFRGCSKEMLVAQVRILIFSPCDGFCVVTYDMLEMKNVEGTDIKEMKKKNEKCQGTDINVRPLF